MILDNLLNLSEHFSAQFGASGEVEIPEVGGIQEVAVAFLRSFLSRPGAS